MKTHIFLLVVLAVVVSGRQRAFGRSKRQVTSDSLRAAVCRAQPTHSICTGQQAPFPGWEGRGTTLSPTTRRTPRTFSTRRPRRPTTPSRADVNSGLCAEYRAEFGRQCEGENVDRQVYAFCADYAGECGRSWEAPSDGKPKFCDNYAQDYNKECRQEIVTQRFLAFCQDYSSNCKVALGPTAAEAISTNPDVTCSEERTRYGGRCTEFEVESAHKDYCIEIHRACGWQLGPDVPDGIKAGQSNGMPSPPNSGQDPSSLTTNDKRRICKANENQARVNCFQSVDVAPEHVRPCTSFIRDCLDYYEDDEPLRKAATLFNSRVGVDSGFGLNGIPYYPLSDGNLAIGDSVGADFGTWGGGATKKQSVGDFFELSEETGANWYEGQYGTQKGFGVPLLPFISGTSGTRVSVPINERTLGDPIGVSKGGGVGPFANWGEGTSVDWLNGNVGSGKSFGVPIIGLGGGSTSGVSFPSIGKFLPLLNAMNGRK